VSSLDFLCGKLLGRIALETDTGGFLVLKINKNDYALINTLRTQLFLLVGSWFNFIGTTW